MSGIASKKSAEKPTRQHHSHINTQNTRPQGKRPTFPPIRKLDMRRLLMRTKGIEHAHPRPPESESQEGAETQPEEGADGDVGADLGGGAFEGVAIGILEVVLEMFFGEGGDVLACVFAEEGEGVGRHFWGCGAWEGDVLEGGDNGWTNKRVRWRE